MARLTWQWQKGFICTRPAKLMLVQIYHWREQKRFVATNMFVATRHIFCQWKKCLFCCNKIMFVMTKLLLRQIFVATSILLSQQAYFCCDQNMLVATKLLSRQIFVTTNVTLSQQAYFSCDKHMFVMTKLLLRQKWYLWQLPPMIETVTGSVIHAHTKWVLLNTETKIFFDLKNI